MEAHAHDLRVEVDNAEWVQRVKTDYTRAALSDVDRALCDHAKKLTQAPASIRQEDIDRLRGLGLTDRAITDATQVISYFNYINRIAEGLSVDLEEGM